MSSGFEERKPKWTSQRCEGVAQIDVASIEEYEEMLAWIYAMRGSGYGFRYKDWGDYKSCSIAATPAFDDQVIGTGDGATAAFQLIKKYTKGLTYTRDIKKPVAGTVFAGIGGVESTTNFSVATTTGIITFDDHSYSISGASDQGGGTTRLITSIGHALAPGDSLYLSGFTGDWSGLNGGRYIATVASGTAVDISFDSSGYTAYSSNGGQLKTLPQIGETVTAGFEFDVPVRFDDDRMEAAFIDSEHFAFSLPLVEIKL